MSEEIANVTALEAHSMQVRYVATKAEQTLYILYVRYVDGKDEILTAADSVEELHASVLSLADLGADNLNEDALRQVADQIKAHAVAEARQRLQAFSAAQGAAKAAAAKTANCPKPVSAP